MKLEFRNPTPDRHPPQRARWVKTERISAVRPSATALRWEVQMADGFRMGKCCACAREGRDVRTIVLLDKRGVAPGAGWGCVVCDLPNDGAFSILCDSCCVGFNEGYVTLRYACHGYPAGAGRTAIEELSPEPFVHDAAKHRAFDDQVRARKNGATKAKGRSEERPSVDGLKEPSP